MVTRALACGLVAALLALSSWARADDAATAEAIFQAAKALADQGKWQEACPKFKASYDLDRQLGTLLNLAHCLEQTRRLAQAWARWNEAIEWARREGDERLGWIEGRERELRPRLPKLVVRVTAPAPALRVEHGDTPVPPASYGIPLAVDPGSVLVRVLRGDEELERRSVEVEEGKVSEVSLDLSAIAAAHPPRAAVPPPKARPEPSPKTPYDPTQRNAGIIVGAVGLGAVLVAAGLEIAALVKKGQADEPDACLNGFCSPEGLEAAEDGATFAEAGQWLGIAGLAVLAVGVTVFLTAPSEDDGASGARLEIAPGGLRGRF